MLDKFYCDFNSLSQYDKDEKHDEEYDSKNYTIKTSDIDMRARIVYSVNGANLVVSVGKINYLKASHVSANANTSLKYDGVMFT